MKDHFLLTPRGRLIPVDEKIVKDGLYLMYFEKIDGSKYGYKNVYKFTKQGWERCKDMFANELEADEEDV